ncbi:MAG: hypothetical protein K2F75_01670, partial [Paramuribaculum sp.]|nr:hypothetical protein [Paramuribaculum sp.]
FAPRHDNPNRHKLKRRALNRPTPPYEGLQNAFDFIRVDGGGLVNNEMYIIRLAPGDYSSKLGI